MQTVRILSAMTYHGIGPYTCSKIFKEMRTGR
jgi:hypothetical protein